MKSAEKMRTITQHVERSSQEQARGMEQISRAILEMDKLTQRTAAGAEESASAGTELDTYAVTLRGLGHNAHVEDPAAVLALL